jgi:cell division transport system permease protein
MALRLDYVAKETGQNLIRNWLLTTATVLIVAVSLSMLAVTMLLGYYGIDNAFVKWNNDVSFIVYMHVGATQEQVDAVDRDLKANKLVDHFEYYDATRSYDLFKKIFSKDSPELVNTLKPEDLPTSFRIKPKNPDAAVVKEMANTFSNKTGVYKVEFPDEQVRQVQNAAGRLRSWAFVGVFVLLAASIMLIFIAIQTAVFSRRREIEVMKLVGATNWFIRIPFLIEGIVQGLLGAGLASLVAKILTYAWADGGSSKSILAKFTWTGGELNTTVFLMLGIGAIVGAIGSALSVTWYLRV